MRLFLLIVLVITLVECGRRNRRKNRKNNEKTEEKDSRIPEDDEVEKEEKTEEKEPEEEKAEEEEAEDLDEDHLSKLTCLLGYKSALKTKLTTCKTDLNSNCVMAHLPVNSEDSDIDMSTTLYGCSPQFSCEQLTGYLDNYEGSYCKTCDLKYDECNKDLQ